jgi:hypothetical protein
MIATTRMIRAIPHQGIAYSCIVTETCVTVSPCTSAFTREKSWRVVTPISEQLERSDDGSV